MQRGARLAGPVRFGLLLLLLGTAACGTEESTHRPARRPRAPRPLAPIAEVEAQARDAQNEDRRSAVCDLGGYKKGDDLERAQVLLRSLLDDPDPEIQAAALEQLTPASIVATQALLLDRLRDPAASDRSLIFRRLLADLENEALIDKAVVAALANPDDGVARDALDEMMFTSVDRPPSLHAALERVAKEAEDPLRRLKAYTARAESCPPQRALEIAREVVAVAEEHERGTSAKRRRRIRSAAVTALAALGPEATPAIPYLVSLLRHDVPGRPDASVSDDDTAALLGRMPSLSSLGDHPAPAAAGILARLGPLAAEAVGPLFDWLVAHAHDVRPFTWHYSLWSYAPTPYVALTRRRLWDRGRAEEAVWCAVRIGRPLEEELLRVWPWLGTEQKQSALSALSREGADGHLLLALATELVEGAWTCGDGYAEALVLAHAHPGPLRAHAERLVRTAANADDEERRLSAWSSLLQAPPRASKPFLGEARRQVLENEIVKHDAARWMVSMAILLRAGGRDRDRAVDVARENLQAGKSLVFVLYGAAFAGRNGAVLLPDLLALADSEAYGLRMMLAGVLGDMGLDTPAVRAALARLRADDQPDVRLFAAASRSRLDNL